MTSENGNYLEYGDQARRFLEQAFEELERNDLRQASEKGWGAASQSIKAVANVRGVEHRGHGHLVALARSLAVELDDDDVRQRFNAGAELHTNFYEGYYNPHEIRERLSRVGQLVDQLDGLLNGRNGASSP